MGFFTLLENVRPDEGGMATRYGTRGECANYLCNGAKRNESAVDHRRKVVSKCALSVKNELPLSGEPSTQLTEG